MRMVMLLVLLGLLTVTIGVAVGARAQDRAMTRCATTPPGFPRRLSRAATGVTVEWKVFPFRYDCVYETRDGIVLRPPP
jgi:hypothetical protein